MKTSLLFSLLYFLFSNSSSAQGNSLLWRISGNNLPQDSYIYGTMHSSDPRVFHFADSVLPAFEMCDAFAMEVVIDESVQSTLLQGIFMNGETTLKSLLTDNQYDSVQWFAMKNAGLSISYFERMKPLYVAMMLEMMSGEDSIIANADPFLDQYFENSAKDQQKKIIGLETAQEQMSIFDVMTYKDQAQLLMKSVREYSTDTTEFEEMINDYLGNDLNQMMKFENDLSIPDSLYDALITQRNIKMAHRIDSLVHLHSTFVAVGAGHLGGDGGLVSLLRAKGYTVIPVIPSFKNYLDDGWYRFHSKKNNLVVDFPEHPQLKIDQNENHYAAEIKSDNGKKESFSLTIIPVTDHKKIQSLVSADKKNFTLDDSGNNFTCQDNDGNKIAGKIFYSSTSAFILTDQSKQKPKYSDRFFQSFAILAE